nr:hypothetical protein [Evansella caseinilytica]
MIKPIDGAFQGMFKKSGEQGTRLLAAYGPLDRQSLWEAVQKAAMDT